MPQTTVSVRMDDKLKKQLEWLCNELGMSISTAVTIFAKTAVRERRIPFDLHVPYNTNNKAIDEMTKSEFNTKIQIGLNAIEAGQVRSAKEAFHTEDITQ